MRNPYEMKVGRSSVARGSVGDRLIFFIGGDQPADDQKTGATLEVPEAVLRIHTITQKEIEDALARYSMSHPLGERCLGLRFAENFKDLGLNALGDKAGLWTPGLSEYSQNRVVVLASGPDAQVRVRLRRAYANGDTKKVVDLMPGDVVEVNVYGFAEVPVEKLKTGLEILAFNARDIIQPLSCAEVDAHYAAIDVESALDAGATIDDIKRELAQGRTFDDAAQTIEVTQ